MADRIELTEYTEIIDTYDYAENQVTFQLHEVEPDIQKQILQDQEKAKRWDGHDLEYCNDKKYRLDLEQSHQKQEQKLKKLKDWQKVMQLEADNPLQEKNHSLHPSAINYYLKQILEQN